ncbi:kinase-like domain-containing protein [Gigaspora margarita]|uniref:Kinase-like domain-containing protein n=1 Tax=Gigaspora margarita TaxID=4874 RepID=A0A8H3XB33_GIGMA|nr:kinase-like domain-containing protein [Gigaspora margarita]
MQYAKMGSLLQNHHKVAQMKWEKNRNIYQNDLYNAYIGDLGFATAVNKTLDSESRGVSGALTLRLAIEICEGLRPTILKSTPLCYAELLRRCWDNDPEKRSTTLEIH